MSVSLLTAIKRTRQELVEAEARTQALRIRLQALEEAADEFAGGDEEQSTANAGSMPRTDAVIAVMRSQPTVSWGAAELRGPVGSMRGTIEDTKDLAAALSYLRSTQKIWSPRRGEWMLAGMSDEFSTLPREDPDDVPF